MRTLAYNNMIINLVEQGRSYKLFECILRGQTAVEEIFYRVKARGKVKEFEELKEAYKYIKRGQII